MSDTLPPQYAVDAPLTEPEHDRLGYDRFAQHLATTIHESEVDRGLVIALSGPWGSGKTTILNFTCQYLKAKSNSPLVVHFNPWWYSSRTDLLESFLSELASADGGVSWKIRRKLRKLWKRLSGVTGPLGLGLSWMPSQPLESMKSALEKELGAHDRRIVVVVDDIDRLQPEELGVLFKVIKSIGSLQRVIYLLAFDEIVVTELLDISFGSSESASGTSRGVGYLEKIVQLPIRMPETDPIALRELFQGGLERVLEVMGVDEIDEPRWAELWIEGLKPLVRTPRDCVRLVNLIGATFPAVKDEVDFVDFLGFQAIRLFASSVFETILRHQDYFVPGLSIRSAISREDGETSEFHASWRDALPEERCDAVQRIVELLFPAVRSAFHSSTRVIDDDAARRERRICSAEVFPVFTRLDVPPEILSVREVEAFFEVTSTREKTKEWLFGLMGETNRDGSTRLSLLLDSLAIDYDKVPEEGREPLISLLLEVGDQLLVEEDEERGLLGTGNRMRITRALYRLSQRVGPERYAELLRESLRSDGGSVLVPVREVYWLGKEHGRHGDRPTVSSDERRLPGDEVEALEPLAADRIAREAQNGRLLNARHVPFLLHWWGEWSEEGEDEPRGWFRRVADEDETLPRLLAGFLGTRHSYSGYQRIEHKLLRVTELSRWGELDELRSRAQDVLGRCGDALDGDQRLAIRKMAYYTPDVAKSGFDAEYA